MSKKADMQDGAGKGHGMKIASFAFRSHPSKGGVEYHQKIITEYFAGRDNDVTVFTSRSDNTDEFFNIDFKFPFLHFQKSRCKLKYDETINGVRYKRFDIRCRAYSYNAMKGLYPGFEEEMRHGGYDIVHLHGLNVYNCYRLAKIADKHGVPVVMSCHDVSIPGNLPIPAKILKWSYDRFIVSRLKNHIREFMVVTRDQIPELKRIGISPKNIRQWSAGFDVERYRRKIPEKKAAGILGRYGLKNNGFVLNMGRIEEYKGVQDIIAIAAGMPGTQFVIAGKDQGYVGKLKEMVSRKGLKNVTFIIGIDDLTAAVLMQNASVFLFPSRKEGWGIVLAEAMSVGVPCIAYEIPNVRTVFTEGKSGFYAKPFDVDAMKARLERILKDKKLHESMSRHAYKEAERYDYHNTLPELEKIYKNTRGQKGKRMRI